jgi:hypothetical protein
MLQALLKSVITLKVTYFLLSLCSCSSMLLEIQYAIEPGSRVIARSLHAVQTTLDNFRVV